MAKNNRKQYIAWLRREMREQAEVARKAFQPSPAEIVAEFIGSIHLAWARERREAGQ